VTHRIVWRAAARADLILLYDWIAEQASPAIALDYTARIEDHVARLADFPAIGTPRDDLHAGLRTLGYRRRTLIAYQITSTGIEILRILHGGRELDGIFDDPSDS